MTNILDGLSAIFWLVATFDADLWEINLRSLQVSLTALVIALVIAIPFGTFLAVQRFRYRRLAISIINALMGLPPAVVGLFVYIMLSRAGPFGVLGLLFTATAMITAKSSSSHLSSHQSRSKQCANYGRNTTTFSSR